MQSADPQNQVIALIRSRNTAEALEQLAAEHKNIHIVETDISNPKALEKSAAKTSSITGGSLDIFIHNGAHMGTDARVLPPSAL